MRIFVCASRRFYPEVAKVRAELERDGHEVTPPNNFDDPSREGRVKATGEHAYAEWKASMLRLQEQKVRDNDAILVLNLEKDGEPNYLGGATFLEAFMAWQLGKPVFLLNPIPSGMLHDELVAMQPVVLDGDVKALRHHRGSRLPDGPGPPA